MSQGNWLRSAGNNMGEETKDAVFDSNGDLVMTGFFNGTFNTGVSTLTSLGNTDIFIMKTDDAGDPIWAVQAGGTGVDKANAIAEDNAGNTYITGYFQSNATFGSINVSGAGYEAFVAKIDQNGNFIWVTTFGGAYGDIGHGITVDNAGNVVCVGEYKGTATFGPDVLTSMNNSTTGTPTYDVFITKLNSSGNFVWTEDGNANQDDRGLEVTTDAANNIYVIGQFSEDITFQTTHSSTLLNAGFIVAYSSAGTELWFDKMWGGQILLADIKFGGGNLYVTGDYQNTLLVEDVSGIQSFSAADQYNIFTAQISTSGEFNWLSANYSASELHSNQLTLDASNNIYITGDFMCTFTEMNDVYGASTFLSVGFEDVHYIKYNSSGVFQWARQVASNQADYCEAITVKTVDKPVLVGYFEGVFYVPAGSTFSFLPGQQVNFSFTNCSDANYGNFAKTNNAGQRDIFWTSPYDPNRDPFDYYEKNPGISCDLLTYEPCIGDEIVFNQCLDTLEGCAPVTATLHDFMLGDIHPLYFTVWSNGGGGMSSAYSSNGYAWATTTTQDNCYTWKDSVYIVVLPEPDPPLISDSWNFNDYNAITNPIDTCDADSVFIWASPSGGSNDSIVWEGNVNGVNDSTILVDNSGTYSVYAVNEYGCVSGSNSVVVVINNFALHDTLDPQISYDDGNILDDDSTLSCILPYCVNVFLVDSAFTNQWGTLPNLYSVWFVDGVFLDTLQHNSDDTLLVQSPTTQNVCVNTTGWHEVMAQLFNDCGDTVFYELVDSFYVDTIPQPIVVVDGPASACPGDTVMITAVYNTADVTWTGTQIIANYGDSVLAVFSPTTGINVFANVDTTVQGITCTNSAAYGFPAIPVPQITVDPIDGVVCPGDSVLLTVTGGVAWQWIGPTGDSLGTNPTQYASDIGEYFCYVTTADGCVVNSEFESTVAYSSPTLYLWDPVICAGDSAMIQVLGPGNTVINWLAPLGGSSFVEYAYAEGWYYCETQYCGITKTDSVFVDMSFPLSGWSMPNDTTICPYDTLTINAPAGFSEYYWNGIIGTNSFQVLDSGDYYLHVIDINGCEDFSDTLQVEYHQLPNPPVASDTTICPGTDALLNAVGSGSITWYSASGNFISAGTFLPVTNVLSNVNYFVTNSDAFCESLPDTASIILFNDNVVSDFNILDTCGSLSVQVQNTGTSGLSYYWYFGDNTNASGSVANHTYPSNNTYTISLVTTDPVCGFEDSTAQQVTVYGQSINAVFNDPTCHQFSDASLTLFLIDGVGGETFLIEDDLGAQVNSTGSNTANNLNAGWYYYFVALGPGCTLTDSVFIPDPAAIDADLNLTHALCYGGTGSAIVDTVYNWQGDYANISFIWNPNPGGVGGIWADSSFNMPAGTYVLTVNDDHGCSNVIDFIITQPDSLIFVELGSDPAYCRTFSYQSGNGVVYAAVSGGTPDYTYEWTNLQTGASVIFSTWGGLNPGDYQILVTDENGCTLTEIVHVDSLNPIADFDMSSLYFISGYSGNSPLEVHFDNLSLYYANPNDPFADTTFYWNFDYDNIPWVISHDINETFDTVYTTGVYTICLTAVNKNGCADTLCRELIVYDSVDIAPPNVFTPDGDGINDEFTFYYKSIGIETVECIVVNRWGVTVREFYNVNDSWDGTDRNGDQCTDGVYFYVYRGVGFNGTEFQGQGTVTLIRN
ncbi:MAG: gliding motility-associated C-terminal domain-containing protein [Crocinitomicaceae bacterium]|nr:gliding motility-associated C-terminal domain-containing protein [Crocinitomicaceae bacterium]MBK8925478.1 gliding motility-associated C-terminal domain-containing protein [Crocinitomicaceae bacterium]